LRGETQLAEDAGHRQRGGEAVTVFYFKGYAEPLGQHEAAVDAFGADLRDQTTGERSHHFGTGTALARDQLRMSEHGLGDDLRGRQSGIRECHPPHRQRIAHDAAPIHGRYDRRFIHISPP
jgi:hypothetical protein